MDKEYCELDWTLDLILELTEEKDEGHRKYENGVRWDEIVEAVEALGWSRDTVEEIISGAIEVGILFEPVLGYLRLDEHTSIIGQTMDGGCTLHHRSNSDYAIHGYADRTDFKLTLDRAREAFRNKTKPVSLVDLRIINLPQTIAQEIFDLLGKYPDAGIIVHPVKGGSA